MTLKEKFLELAFAKISSEDLRDECEKIADDYAIEFAKWIMDCYVSELTLEIFKKQKGL